MHFWWVGAGAQIFRFALAATLCFIGQWVGLELPALQFSIIREGV
jgi:hypothetical protein